MQVLAPFRKLRRQPQESLVTAASDDTTLQTRHEVLGVVLERLEPFAVAPSEVRRGRQPHAAAHEEGVERLAANLRGCGEDAQVLCRLHHAGVVGALGELLGGSASVVFAHVARHLLVGLRLQILQQVEGKQQPCPAANLCARTKVSQQRRPWGVRCPAQAARTMRSASFTAPLASYSAT